MALLSVIAVPTYHHFQETQHLEGVAQLLQNEIELAKTLSLTRGETVNLCASQNQKDCDETWQGRLFVYTSKDPAHIETILAQSEALPRDITVRFQAFNNNEYVSFNPSAELNYNGSFYLDSPHKSLRVKVSKTGIVTITTV